MKARKTGAPHLWREEKYISASIVRLLLSERLHGGFSYVFGTRVIRWRRKIPRNGLNDKLDEGRFALVCRGRKSGTPTMRGLYMLASACQTPDARCYSRPVDIMGGARRWWPSQTGYFLVGRPFLAKDILYDGQKEGQS